MMPLFGIMKLCQMMTVTTRDEKFCTYRLVRVSSILTEKSFLCKKWLTPKPLKKVPKVTRKSIHHDALVWDKEISLGPAILSETSGIS